MKNKKRINLHKRTRLFVFILLYFAFPIKNNRHISIAVIVFNYFFSSFFEDFGNSISFVIMFALPKTITNPMNSRLFQQLLTLQML